MNTTNETPTLQIADSKFIGFVQLVKDSTEAVDFQASLKTKYQLASHVPFCWVCGNNDYGFIEDGEPEHSCGELILSETKRYFNEFMTQDDEGRIKKLRGSKGIVLVIVRFFGERLLGVTCGRLGQCYQSISNLTLHRFFRGSDISLHQDFVNTNLIASKFGMGAGDCEVILDILSDIEGSEDRKSFPQRIMNELNFGGFKGNRGEELPRLQNLQANISGGIVPVYRYPGNYRGDEWETFQWSPTSLQVKDAVENHLKPLYNQEMNHCVSNYYRDGNDYIDHHSDKDLDLDKNAVIVSVSIGDERVLELKRRSIPRDTTRITLPHGSMLVLGPFTNKLFTHSILKKEESVIPRLSLTFRHVTTFADRRTKRLFGEGVANPSLETVRRAQFIENILFVIGFSGIAALLNQHDKPHRDSRDRNLMKKCISTTGLFGFSYISYRYFGCKIRLFKEEQQARQFFSKTSVNGTKY